MSCGGSSRRLKLRIMDPDEPRGEPLPIFCKTCGDQGTIPADPIFVNTDHSYGVEYRSEDPCPDCTEAVTSS